MPLASLNCDVPLPQSALLCLDAGAGLDFISSNVEAQRALMLLHPCKLMKVEPEPSTSPTPAAPALKGAQLAASPVPGAASVAGADSLASSSKKAQNRGPGQQMARQPAADPSTYKDVRAAQVSLKFPSGQSTIACTSSCILPHLKKLLRLGLPI